MWVGVCCSVFLVFMRAGEVVSSFCLLSCCWCLSWLWLFLGGFWFHRVRGFFG